MNYKWILIPVIFLLMIGMSLAYKTIGPLESGPDITFYYPDIIISPENPKIGEVVNVTAIIINKGDVNASEFFWNEFDFDGKDQNYTYIYGLEPNETKNKTVSYIFGTAGIHQVKVKLDVYNNVSESNESNNIAYKNITVYELENLPDLTFVHPNISVSPENIFVGDYVNITAHIINNGTANATNFSVLFRIPTFLFEHSVQIDNLMPKEEMNVTFYGYVFNFSGQYQIQVVLDKNNTVIESDEDFWSNFAYKNIEVYADSEPDLTFYPPEISFDTNPIVGEPTNITIYIINQGNATSSDYDLNFVDYTEGFGKYWRNEPPLAAGENTTKTFTHIFNKSGLHTILLEINFSLGESNYSNNIVYKNITVQGANKPDLTLTSSDISFNPTNPLEGDDVTIEATIHNIGDADANNYAVQFYDVTENYVIEIVTGINTPQGSNSTVQTTYYNVKAGSHVIRVTADYYDTIDELNESNNVAWKTLTVGQEGAKEYNVFLKNDPTSSPPKRHLWSYGNLTVTRSELGNPSTITLRLERIESPHFATHKNFVKINSVKATDYRTDGHKILCCEWIRPGSTYSEWDFDMSKISGETLEIKFGLMTANTYGGYGVDTTVKAIITSYGTKSIGGGRLTSMISVNKSSIGSTISTLPFLPGY